MEDLPRVQAQGGEAVRERGVAVSKAAHDLDLHKNVLRKWVREQAVDPGSVFPGYGVMGPEQQEMSGCAAGLPG